MDSVQAVLCQMIKDVPDCIESKQKLYSVLVDYIPTDKLKINLLLDAYSEEIVDKLRTTSDKALTSLNIVKQLKENYGITNDAAIWSVVTWCYLLSFDQIGEALEKFEVNLLEEFEANKNKHENMKPAESVSLHMGVYKAGLDFPYGELSLEIKDNQEAVTFGIADSPNEMDCPDEFMYKTYIRIEKGQFLKLDSWHIEKTPPVIITKIE